MGKVIIQSEYTTQNPITMIGKEAGICWGADITDDNKNRSEERRVGKEC